MATGLKGNDMQRKKLIDPNDKAALEAALKAFKPKMGRPRIISTCEVCGFEGSARERLAHRCRGK